MQAKPAAYYNLLFLGLDGSGKTQALYHIVSGEKVHTIPTIGFNIESVPAPGKPGVMLKMYDIGGQERLRGLWRHYYSNI